MISLYIDPVVLSCPKNQKVQEFQEYISLLLDIELLSSAKWVSIYTSCDCYQILEQTDSYPVWNDLRSYIDNFSIDYVDPHDINRIIEYLIIHTISIEKLLEEHLIIECPSLEDIQIIPQNLLGTREKDFLEFHKYFAVMVGILSLLKVDNLKNDFLVTRSLNINCHTNLAKDRRILVKLQGKIESCKDFLTYCCLSLPISLDHELYYCTSKEGIYLSIDPAIVGTQISLNEDEADFKEMVDIYVFRKKYGEGHPSFEVESLKWSIGKSFINTASELGFLTEPIKFERLLRTCYETLLEENMADTHALRTNRGGGSPQRERISDKAKAWRRDIDWDYHLHYWKTSNHVELASVVIHEDFTIPL